MRLLYALTINICKLKKMLNLFQIKFIPMHTLLGVLLTTTGLISEKTDIRLHYKSMKRNQFIFFMASYIFRILQSSNKRD